jgi:chemotaxis signal transduction protein
MDTITGQTQVVGTPEAMNITCDFLAFHLDEREFAVPLAKVCELRTARDVALRSGWRNTAHDAAIGTLLRNGEEIPVFDLHCILSLPSMCQKGTFDVIVVKSMDQTYAIAVDDAIDVVTLTVNEFMLVTSPAPARNHIWALTMHEERVLRLLDTDSLVPNTKTEQQERLAA